MKNLPGAMFLPKLAITILIIWCGVKLQAQFQTAIGYPFPANERGVRGVMTNSGNFLIFCENWNHPLGIANTMGDLQVVQLNSQGHIVNPSIMIGNTGLESAAWLEKTVCGNGGYIIAGHSNHGSGNDMIVTRTDLNLIPVWSKSIGAIGSNETSACIKEDGNGDFILLGTTDVNGDYAVRAVKLDCTGKQIWNKTYSLLGSFISMVPTSITEFATLSTGCSNLQNEYFITGSTVDNSGTVNVFILSINVANGNLSWMNTYDIAPNTIDYPTCIQGSCTYNSQLNGELWVSGYSQNTTNNAIEIFMMKTSTSGNLLWANNYYIVGDVELPTHFRFNAAGDILLTGRAEGLVSPPRPATRSGQCFLMKIRNDGNQIYWTHIYEQGFASQGENLETLLNNEYFITGYSYKSDPPAAFDFNILAIKTDSLGQTASNCFHNPITDIVKRAPVVSKVSPVVTSNTDTTTISLLTKTVQDSQIFCVVTPKQKCDSLFTFLDRLHTLPMVCCFNLVAYNPNPNCFTKIQLTLSSGSFNNVNPNVGWTLTGGPSQFEFNPSSGFVPTGSVNPGSFCVGGTSNPFTLVISYLYASNGAVGKCEERYILNCPAAAFEACDCPNGSIPGPNLVVNGDFLNGNTGFTTGYPYVPPPTAFGFAQYSIRNSTNLINSAWACTDHTSGLPLGEFLAVDGSTLTFVPCWQEYVYVDQGKQYSFCAYVNNMVNPLNSFNDPIVQLWINNTLQATVTLPEIPDVWVKLSAGWTSNVTGFIPIEIRPGTPTTAIGCDFAVDDIAFHECVPDFVCDSNACRKNLVSNPGFFQGAILGNFLGINANSNNWSTATQSPQVVNDSCCDPVAIEMWGNRDKGESICQNLNFKSGHTYTIHFCGRFLNQPTLSTKYIRFGFSATNACNSTYSCSTPNCEKIGESGMITNQSWNTYSLTNWTASSNWTNLVVRAFNNNKDIQGIDTTVSWGLIDDICIEDLTTATENLSSNAFSVYPNPANSNLIIELNQSAGFGYSISAFDMVGKKVINKVLTKGEKRITLDVSQIPNGLYLVELRDNHFKSWYRKIVKE
jgi:hypothetical protein